MQLVAAKHLSCCFLVILVVLGVCPSEATDSSGLPGSKKLKINFPSWQVELAEKNISKIRSHFKDSHLTGEQSVTLFFTLNRKGNVSNVKSEGSGFQDSKLQDRKICAWKNALISSQPLVYRSFPGNEKPLNLMLLIDASNRRSPIELVECVPPHFNYLPTKPKP